MKRRHVFLSRRLVTVLTLLLLFLSAFLLWIFMQSQQGILQAEKEARALVELDYPIKEVNEFYWTTNDKTYFSMDFVDKAGQERYAIINQDGGDISYYTPIDIISKEDAQAIAASENKIAKFMNVRLGKLDGVPVWEVSFKDKKNLLHYYYINATNGQWIQTIGNL